MESYISGGCGLTELGIPKVYQNYKSAISQE